MVTLYYMHIFADTVPFFKCCIVTHGMSFLMFSGRPFRKLLIDGQRSHTFESLVLNLVGGFSFGSVYRVSGLIHMMKCLILEATSKFYGLRLVMYHL